MLHQVRGIKMNYIDIVVNKTKTCVSNNVVEIYPHSGIPGKDGSTPYIDEETGHWFIDDKDTGIKASYETEIVDLINRVKVLEEKIASLEG